MQEPECKYFPVKVFVRVKKDRNDLVLKEDCIKLISSKNLCSEFHFDKVFGPNSSTLDIYNEIERSLSSNFKLNERCGFLENNLTIFAYGQTGSGKTYTMNGNEDNEGLNSMIIRCILRINTIQISFFEIYNENIVDLLDGERKPLREIKGQAFIPNLIVKDLTCLDDYKSYNGIVNRNRKTAETNLNQNSSRSHLVVRLDIGGRLINLVDLAGSENNKRTGNVGDRMIESSNINRSLFTLNKVVSSIVNKQTRIPYRDSKLTRLLQESLGGNGVCYIIATVIDRVDDSMDLMNTLAFASKSKKILNKKPDRENIYNELHKFKNPINSQNKSIKPEKNNSLLRLNRFGNTIDNKHKRINQMKENFNEKVLTHKSSVNVKDKESECENIKIYYASNESIKDFSNIYEIEDDRLANNDLYNISNKASETTNIYINNKTTSNHNLNKRICLPSIPNRNVEMTPTTKKKSSEYFLNKAVEHEKMGENKKALEIYKTVNKFASSEFVAEKINSLQKARKKNVLKYKSDEALKILNSGNFLDIKKLNGIGDKKAQMIVDFVKEGNIFEIIDDLRHLFNEKIVNAVYESIES